MARPEASRRGVMTTRATNSWPFLRSRLIVPSHLPSAQGRVEVSLAAPGLGHPWGWWRMDELALPTTSPAS